MSYLHPGLPQPAPAPDGLDQPFWEGLQREALLIQFCSECSTWQWGPEWICHRCHSMQLQFCPTPATGRIYSYERVWHPVHPALKDQGAYLIVLVELTDGLSNEITEAAPSLDGVRMVGNLLGDPHQDVVIGSAVTGVFEHHMDADPAFTLLQWSTAIASSRPEL